MVEALLAVCVGVGLAAAAGFRIFVPLLVMSLAAHSGHLQLAHGFEWIGSWPAIVAFSVATVLEICAYYIPWLDNLLDSMATPAAVVAGTVLTAAAVAGLSPMLQWSLAIIAGGGVAAVVQSATVTTRAASSVATAGFGNFIVSSVEAAASTLLSFLAIILAPLAILLAGVLVFLLVRTVWVRRSWRARAAV
ncbi:MAG: DUF4126 family protein [Phycisphaera sp.]|nr:DUF4126 family protein [Phycisphaera sp.]